MERNGFEFGGVPLGVTLCAIAEKQHDMAAFRLGIEFFEIMDQSHGWSVLAMVAIASGTAIKSNNAGSKRTLRFQGIGMCRNPRNSITRSNG
jgi:hypothetical protein